MDDLVRAVEAALFAAEEPMTAEALAGFLGDAAVGDVRAALRSEMPAMRGNPDFERSHSAVFASAWVMETHPALDRMISSMELRMSHMWSHTVFLLRMSRLGSSGFHIHP